MSRFLLISILALVVLAGCSVDDNVTPEITSETEVEATGSIYFCYRATWDDPDNLDDTAAFYNFPSWLTAAGDSLYGTPPDGADDTSFIVSVYDGHSADSQLVSIDLIPCLAVYGDTRSDHDSHRSVVEAMMTVFPAAVFHTGDLVNDGRIADQWDTFNIITGPMRSEAEFFPSLGNHEYQSRYYFDNFELPNNEEWYSVDRINTHFIILNSCRAVSDTSEQYRWLEADLAGINDSIQFIVAIFHHPPYSTGQHDEDEQGLRETWVPLFEQYGVDIVFNGHDHDYERSYCGGIYYIVAGGGGAPLRDQARTHPCSQKFVKSFHFCKLSIIGGKMLVRVYDPAKSLIDAFEIESEPVRAAVG